jgi:type I restriction enzyme S subunit
MQKLHKFKKTELGEIPEEWLIDKLGNFVDILVGFPFPSKEYSENGIRLVRGDNVTEGKLRWADRTRYWKTVTPQLKKFLLKKDDFLLGMDGSKVGKNYARVKENDLPCLLVQRVACLRVNDKLIQNYLDYVIGNKDFINYVESTKTNAAIPHISSRQISDYKIIVPPLKEQQKIASILSNVDELIQKTEQIIEQTQRLKKGLMQRLLTKGIGHTKFKKTELGEIPQEWDVQLLENITEKVSVGIATSTTKYFAKTGVPILRNQNIKEAYIDKGDLIYITDDFAKLNSSRALREGDVICVRTGNPGQSAVVTSEMNGWQTFTTLIVRPLKDIIDSYYLCRFFNSITKTKIKSLQAGGIQQNLNAGWLAKIKVHLPPLKEQQKIASILSNVDELIQKQQMNKSKLENLKKGLMQQLLTGKIRVKV